MIFLYRIFTASLTRREHIYTTTPNRCDKGRELLLQQQNDYKTFLQLPSYAQWAGEAPKKHCV
jgi:hypothetical protein